MEEYTVYSLSLKKKQFAFSYANDFRQSAHLAINSSFQEVYTCYILRHVLFPENDQKTTAQNCSEDIQPRKKFNPLRFN